MRAEFRAGTIGLSSGLCGAPHMFQKARGDLKIVVRKKRGRLGKRLNRRRNIVNLLLWMRGHGSQSCSQLGEPDLGPI